MLAMNLVWSLTLWLLTEKNQISRHPGRINAFVDTLSYWSTTIVKWAPYEPILRAGLESDDPATADAAQTLIDKKLRKPEH